MGFPDKVQAEALAACERCCCICHKFCGTKIELHHIKQKADGGEDTFDNCIPLCFDCHADIQPVLVRQSRRFNMLECFSYFCFCCHIKLPAHM